MKKIILLNGASKSGKDAVAAYLTDNYDFRHHKFADPIRAVVKALFPDVDVEEFKTTMVGPDYPGRFFMIEFAENLVKPNLGAGFFAQALADKLKDPFYHYTHRNTNIVISDLGFQVEIDTFYQLYRDFLLYCETPHQFEIWNVDRPGCSFSGDSRDWVYRKSIPSRTLFNHSNLNELYNQVKEFMNE